MEVPQAMNTQPEDFLFALAVWESEQLVESIYGGQGKPMTWILEKTHV